MNRTQDRKEKITASSNFIILKPSPTHSSACFKIYPNIGPVSVYLTILSDLVQFI